MLNSRARSARVRVWWGGGGCARAKRACAGACGRVAPPPKKSLLEVISVDLDRSRRVLVGFALSFFFRAQVFFPRSVFFFNFALTFFRRSTFFELRFFALINFPLVSGSSFCSGPEFYSKTFCSCLKLLDSGLAAPFSTQKSSLVMFTFCGLRLRVKTTQQTKLSQRGSLAPGLDPCPQLTKNRSPKKRTRASEKRIHSGKNSDFLEILAARRKGVRDEKFWGRDPLSSVARAAKAYHTSEEPSFYIRGGGWYISSIFHVLARFHKK